MLAVLQLRGNPVVACPAYENEASADDAASLACQVTRRYT